MGIAWGLATNSLWYTTDGDNWTDAGNPTGAANLNGIWGCTVRQKVYVAAGGAGIYSYEMDVGWTLEDNYTSLSPKTTFDDQWFLSIWCSSSDNLVCCSGAGTSHNLIRTRDGTSGSWTTEYTGETVSYTEQIIHVHGQDGYAAFAIAHEEDGGRRSTLLMRDGGTWTEVAGLGDRTSDMVSWYRVRVLAYNDIRIMGESDIGGTNYSKIWKWDGTTLTEQYSVLASSTTFNDFWMEETNNGWLLDDDGSTHDAYVDTGSGWTKKSDITGTGETESKYTICADSQDLAWVLGNDLITKWNGSSWTGQTMTGTPVFYQSFYSRYVTLWASGIDDIWYSTKSGALGSWIRAEPDASWGTNDTLGVYGPSTEFKIYTVVEETGIASWDGFHWTLEYDTGGSGPYPFSVPPEVLSVWCNQDDTLVIGSAFGDDNEQLVVRQGAPGSTWYVEFDGAAGGNDYTPYAVHGTANGTHVFAIVRDNSNYDMVLFKRTAGTPGSWSEVARRSSATFYVTWVKLQVISDTEVWIAGIDEISASNYNARIWKWNGSTLSVEYTGPSEWYGQADEDSVGLWVNPDGSEGWACFHGNDAASNYEKFVRFNGSAWSFFQEVETSVKIHNVTQYPGDINSARAIYGYGSYDIFNLKGDNLWPNEYAFGSPPTENYRKVWPGATVAIDLLYIGVMPGAPSAPPLISNEDPVPDETEVSINKIVSFDITDADGDLQLDTVLIELEGYTAYQNEAFVSPYNDTGSAVTPITDGYTFEIEKNVSFDYNTSISIDAYAQDSLGNTLDESWSFTTEAPPVSPYFATAGTSGGAKILKGTSGEMIEAHNTVEGDSRFSDISGTDGNLLAVGGEYPLGSGDAIAVRLQNGKWIDETGVRTANEENYTSCYLFSSGTEYLLGGSSVGDGHGIWKWNGSTLTKVLTTTVSITAIAASSDSNIWAGTEDGTVYQSTDGAGASWTSKRTADSNKIAGLSILGTTPYASIAGNVYVYTGSWNAVGSTGSSTSYKLHAVSTSEIWLAAYFPASGFPFPTPASNRILQWTGSIWVTRYSSPGENYVFFDVKKNSATGHIYAVGHNSGAAYGIYSENGTSWNSLTFPANFAHVNAIHFSENNTPELRDPNPTYNETNVSVSSDIYIEIVDPEGIDGGTVDITVGGSSAWTSDAQQSGFSVTKGVVDDGYSYTIDPDSDFTSQNITVEIDGYNSIGEWLSTSYSFSVDVDLESAVYFSTTRTDGGASEPTVLKSHHNSVIAVHTHIDSDSSGFAGLATYNDYILAVGNFTDEVEESARASYLKNGLWRDIRRVGTETNEEKYSSAYIISDGYFLLGGGSTNDGYGIWRYNGPPVATNVFYTDTAVVAMDGSSSSNIWAITEYSDAYQCTDGVGTTWTNRGQISNDGYGISVVDGSTVYAAVNDDVYSWSGGSSWAAVGSVGMTVFALHAISSSEIWAAGFDSGVSQWKIKAWGGSSWTEKYSTAEANISTIKAIRKDLVYGHVYCVGGLSDDSWGIYSLDGDSWSSITWPSGYGNITDVRFVPDNAPTIRNASPRPGQGLHYIDQPFEFEIVDPAGIDESSVVIQLEINSDAYSVWTGDTEQDSFNVTKSSVSGGVKYAIGLDCDLPPNKEIVVSVYAEDNDGYALDTEYFFHTAHTFLTGGYIYYTSRMGITTFDGKEVEGSPPYWYLDPNFGGYPIRQGLSVQADGYFVGACSQTTLWMKYNDLWYTFGVYYNGSADVVMSDVDSFIGCYADPNQEFILVCGKGTNNRAGLWKILTSDNSYSRVWNASDGSEGFAIHGNDDASLIIASGNYSKGVRSIDGGSTFVEINTPSWYTTAIHVRSDGIAYAGVRRYGSNGLAVYRYENDVWTAIERMPVHGGDPYYYAQEIYAPDDYNIWIRYWVGPGTAEKLYHFDGFEWKLITTLDYGVSWRCIEGRGNHEVRVSGFGGGEQIRYYNYDGYEISSIESWSSNFKYGEQIDYVELDLIAPSYTTTPIANSYENEVDSTVVINLLDSDSGVDPSTVIITIESEVAWTGDAQAGDFTASKSSTSFGYRYTLDRNYDYDYADDVLVELYAEDYDGNALDTSWTWSTDLREPLWSVGLYGSGNDSDGYELIDRWNGHTWIVDTVDAYAAGELFGIWAYDRDNAWMVGEPGPSVSAPTVLYWNGTGWDNITIAGASGTLRSVFGTDADSVYVCGDSDLVYYYDGVTWDDISGSLPVSADWYGIYAAASDDAFMVSRGGHVVRWDGATWSLVSSDATYPLNAVHGSTANNVFVVGDDGYSALWNGSIWEQKATSSADHINDVFVLNSTNAYYVDDNGKMRRWNGSSWLSSALISEAVDLLGVYARTTTQVWAVADDGSIYFYDGSSSSQTSGTTAPLNDVFGPAPDVTGPELQNLDPSSGQTGVPPNTDISFDIIDSGGSGIDELSVQITIDGRIAWQDDTEQDGYTVTKSSVSGGFNYSINPDNDFSVGATVQVDVYAEDNGGPPNVLDTSYTFDIEGVPIISNRDPAPDETEVSVDKVVSFDVTDEDGNLRLDTTVITIEGNTAYTSEAFVAPYDGGSSAVTPIVDGYTFEIDKTGSYDEYSTITAAAYAEDTQGGILDTSWSFFTEDNTEPVLQNQNPAPSASNVALYRDIYLEIIDSYSGLDVSTVEITIDGEVAWTSDAIQSGFTGSKSSITNGYSYTLNKTDGLSEGQSILVEVYAQDRFSTPNTLDTSYSFTTRDVFPYIINQDPAPDEVDVPADSYVEFDAYDIGGGINVNSVIVSIDGSTAWSGDVAQAGFTGSRTAVVDGDGYDGYHYQIIPDTDLIAGPIPVSISGADVQGNPFSESYSFTVFGIVPELRGRSPSPDSTGVTASTNITFYVIDRDIGGVDPDTVDAYVGGNLAFEGITQSFISPFDGPGSSFVESSYDGYDGYKVVIDKTSNFSSYELISVRVVARDIFNGQLDETYYFRIADTEDPVVADYGPSGSSVARDAIVYAEFYDDGTGIDLDSVEAYVNNVKVYDVSGFVAGYDGAQSDLVSKIVDGYDGYRLTIEKTSNYPSSGTVSVRLIIPDKEGN